MSIAALALLAALTGSPQVDAAPRIESRSELRIVTADGEGPGRMDTDGDGVITREEFSTPMGAAFDRLDADHDGRLTTEELAAGHGDGHGGAPHVMMMRRPVAPDGHGGHGGPMIFHGGPESGDVQVFSFRRGEHEGHGPDGPDERRVEVRRFGGPQGHDGMDTDNDGKVSEAEFLAPLREAFQNMDADHDGSLEAGEGHHAPPPPPAD